MLFHAAVQSQGAYLLVTTSGPAELPELCALADFPAAVARRRGCKRALFDLLALEPVLTASQHIELGEHIASTLVGFERIAVVLAHPADRVAADVAAAKGLALKTFSTLHEAEEWLSD